jgi:hypothetical protein
MNNSDDCFLPQGDTNGTATCTVNAQTVACTNLWNLEKITGSSGSANLDCDALAEGTGVPEAGCEVPPFATTNVQYHYTVHNSTNAATASRSPTTSWERSWAPAGSR